VLYNNTCNIFLVDLYIEHFKIGDVDLDIVRNHLMNKILIEVIF
jgi:hypothetical protein